MCASGPRSTPRARPSVAQERVLAVLREQGGEVTVELVSERLASHPNTVREHLTALVGMGLVRRAAENGGGVVRGRPAIRYSIETAAVDPWGGEHVELTLALAEELARLSPDPAGSAREAGARWGAKLAVGPDGAPTGVAVGVEAARERLVNLLERKGFGPREVVAGQSLELTSCPFLDMARANRTVICQVHAGLVAGFLAAEDPGWREGTVRLEPFAGPGGCRLDLAV